MNLIEALKRIKEDTSLATRPVDAFGWDGEVSWALIFHEEEQDIALVPGNEPPPMISVELLLDKDWEVVPRRQLPWSLVDLKKFRRNAVSLINEFDDEERLIDDPTI